MFAVFTVLLILAISLVVVRVATVALTLTGLSKDLAEFQSLSAFTRAGYTTRESEEIVNHPVRRRIIMLLMLTGNAGIVIAITTLLRAFTQTNAEDAPWYNDTWFRFTVLSLGVLGLWAIASSKIVERGMWNLNSWAVRHWTHIDVMDYMGLLRVTRDYAVCELQVREDDWVSGKTLIELQLPREGVIVLGIEREDGHYLGAPRGTSVIQPGDTLLLYGRQETLQDLDTRRSGFEGNMHHVIAVTRHIDVLDEEIAEEQHADQE